MERFKILKENKLITNETYNYIENTVIFLEKKGYKKHETLTTHLAIALERLKKGEDIDPANDHTLKMIKESPDLNKAKSLYKELFSNPPVKISKNEKTYLILHLLTLILAKNS